MEKKLNITAICGWALPEEWFRKLVAGYFPNATVRACYPMKPDNDQEATSLLADDADWLIGYSLGSLWLLHHKNKIKPQTRIALLAPILAFTAEQGAGGKTPLAKLKYQKKILLQSNDYAAAMRGFFDISGIRLPENDLKQPYGREVLIRGLEFLENFSVPPQTAKDCIALSGGRDPLLEGLRLKELIPHLNLMNECDHSPQPLLAHLAQHPEVLQGPGQSVHQPSTPQQAV